MLDEELAAKLERATANNNTIVAVNVTDRERIRGFAGDEMPVGLGELRSVVVKQLAQRREREARDQLIRDQARARSQAQRA
jgi:hypothetical protein